MQTMARQNWGIGTSESHTAIMRNAALADLAALARSYDWSAHPEPVLGWVMAQTCIDLGNAVTVFFGGEPERFNYLSKREVPRCYVPGARLLDNICLRINCGFYLPDAQGDAARMVRLANWTAAQKADRGQGTSGRWVLDEDIVARLAAGGVCPHPAKRIRPAPQGAMLHVRLRALLVPRAVGGMRPAPCRPGERG